MSANTATQDLSTVAIRYQSKTPQFRRYLTTYVIASIGIALLWSSILAILLPLQVQQIEFSQYFAGADSNVDLPALEALRTQVDSGEATPTEAEAEQLETLANYNAAKASGLSLVTSAGIVLTMVLQPLIGMLSDRTRTRWGRRAPWIAGGAFVGAIMIAIMPSAPNIGVLLIVWALVQLIVNAAQGPLTATVADRVPEDRIGTVSAITGVVGFLIAGVGVAGVGALFAVMGLNTYLVLAFALVVSVVPLLLLARDTSTVSMTVPKLQVGAFFASYAAGLRDRDYRWAWIAKVTLFVGYGIGSVYSIYMLQSYVTPALTINEAAQTAPLLLLAGIPSTIIAMAISGRWSDKIGRRKPFVFAASVIMAVSFIVPWVWPSLPAMYIQAALSGFGLGLYIVVDQALFIDVLPDKLAAGRDLGMSTTGQNIGQALAPIVAGGVVAVAGGQYGPVYPVAVVIALISAFAILPIRRVR